MLSSEFLQFSPASHYYTIFFILIYIVLTTKEYFIVVFWPYLFSVLCVVIYLLYLCVFSILYSILLSVLCLSFIVDICRFYLARGFIGGSQILQKSRRHLQILGARRVT
jgi:hypothetical protein